jgi:predicted DNA-binding transcriptional regulator YafY
VQSTLTLDLIRAEHAPDRELLMVFSEAAQQSRQVLMQYQAEGAELSERAFDPYGLVYRQGRWYAVGFCHLRQDLRMFRLDRIAAVCPGEASFVRPDDFDAAAYVVQSIARIPNTWEVEVQLHVDPGEARKRVPPVFGTLMEEDSGVVLYAYAESLGWFARELVALDLPFSVRRPPELREELRTLAEQIMLATAGDKVTR